MDGIKVSVHHAAHYQMSSSEDDYSDLSSDDLDEVEDVMEDATIEYSELATASGRKQFIHRLTCAGLQGSDNNLEEACGSDYFVKEIGYNFDNSEQPLFLDSAAARNEFSVHLNGVGEQVLCDESDRTETPSCSHVTSPSVGAAVPNGELRAHLQIPKPNSDDALRGSEQVSSLSQARVGVLEHLTDELLLQSTPQEKPVITNALQTTENLPKFKVVRMKPAEAHPVVEPLHGTSSDATALDVKSCYDILSEVESLLEPSPSHSEFSPPGAPCNASPGVILESHHVSDSTNAPQDPSSTCSSAAKGSICDDSLIDALQRSLAKKAAPEDSYETTSTDLSRESSLSSTCRLSLGSRDRAREGDDNEKKEVKIITSGKGKGKKKKKVAQTRRAHNCRAFKKTADQPSSERESSSDELEDQEWISNRPITRHFFNNLDKFCNRASRPRKSKPRGRPRKNAGSSKPTISQPQPIPAVQSLPPPTQPANPALNEHLLVAPVALDLLGDAATLAADANAVLDPYMDELFEEEELMRMFPSHLTQVIEEAGLNISDLTFSTSADFDDIRCDESVMDPVNGNLVPFSELTASVAAAAQPMSVSSSTASAAVELQLPTISCEKPTEVIKFTDDASALPAQIELHFADESQLPLKSESLGSNNSDPGIVSEPMIKNSDIPLKTESHFPLKPDLSPAQEESVSPSPLPNIRPGSVVLAYMDAYGNLVPVSSTGITMEEVQSAVAEELGSSYKDNPSLKSASEPTPSKAAACDVKPDLSALEVASLTEDVECNLFAAFDMKQNKDEVLVTPAPAVLTNTPAEEEINVKVEPLNINVKEEVTGDSSCSDASDSLVDECKVKLPSSVSSSSSNGESGIALQPKKSVPIIKDENSASLPTRIGTDRPVDRLATTHPIIGKAPLSPSTEGVICKIPDYLQTIFKEQKCEDSLPGQGNAVFDVTLAVKASSETDNSEIGASDIQEKSCSTGTSSDSSEHSSSQKARKKINVSEYFKRKNCVASAPKGSARSASVNQAKQDASASSKFISKTLPHIAKTRPEITNIKSMLSDDVPEYSKAVVPQDSAENQVLASGIAKSAASTGAVISKSKNAKVSTSKCVSGTQPKIVTDVSQNMLQAKAQNLPRDSKDIRTNDAQVSHSKAPKSENCEVKNPATVIENSDKLPVANRQISVPTEAEREAVTRVAKKVLASFEPAHAQTSRGKSESERCISPCSRSSSIGSLRGRKRDRSSSVVSSSYTSDSIDSRKSRRRCRHRSTSPSVSPIPLFHKKRNKKSHKRHKSHRKRRRQSSSSSSRSRSPLLSRRRRRSFSPAWSRSRSRSLSSNSYGRKKRSGKRSRYNSRSRSRSFSPNTVYSVGCACGGGDPKFVGHLPSCQHYSPDARYPTPEPPLRPSQQYYHPPQYPYQHPAQYPYYPYYYDFNAGPPQDYGGAYLHGRRSETDTFVYSRSARPSSVPDPNLRAKQVEERLVVYVGRLRAGTKKEWLEERFKKFGTVTNASVHTRTRGDDYGFVTYSNSEEANRAIEDGNKGEEWQFDLCFGGRRQFCRQQYKDLDAVPTSGPHNKPVKDFDTLLKECSRR